MLDFFSKYETISTLERTNEEEKSQKENIFMITQLMNNNYCYLWQSETDTLTMLNRHTGDKIEFKIL